MKTTGIHMLETSARFVADEDGAVSVDWVVLTAAIVGLGVAILVNVGGTAQEHGGRVEDAMVSRGIATY